MRNVAGEELRRFEAIVPDAPQVKGMLKGWLSSHKATGRAKIMNGCTQFDEGEQCYEINEDTGTWGLCEIDVCGGGGDDGGDGDDPWPEEDGGGQDQCNPLIEFCDEPGGGGDSGDSGGNGTSGCDPNAINPPGGCEQPDPCEEDNPPAYCENPCETGDPILDDEGIQIGFESMWEDSNYGSDSNPNPENQRKEQIGFIVPNGFGGHQLQRLSSSFITDSGPCRMRFKVPANLPEGTILVHTHPYSKGDSQNHCVPGKTYKYDNVPGVEDRPTLDILGLDQGIILDADKVIQFTPNESEQPTLINRCGY